MQWDIFNTEDACKKLYDTCLSYINDDLLAYKNQKLDISFKLGIEKESINAAASVDDCGKYRITLEMAAVTWICEFYNRIMVNPGFYSLVSYETDFNQEVAEMYVEKLSEITLKNIVFHECGHVYNGHVDYIKLRKDKYNKDNSILSEEKEGTYSLYEISSKARPYLLPKEWQALEWNADDFAVTRMVGQFAFEEAVDGKIIKSIEHGLWLVMVSSVVMYALMGMGSDRKKEVDFKELEHLPKRFRTQKYIETSIGAFKNINGYIPSIEMNMLMECAKKIEQWVNMYMFHYYQKRDWSEANNVEELDNAHREYYGDVEAFYLLKLPEMLRDFSYFQIYDDDTQRLVDQAVIKSVCDNKFGEDNWVLIRGK